MNNTSALQSAAARETKRQTRPKPVPLPQAERVDIPARIRTHALARPHDPALIDGDATMTAQDMALWMDRIAAALEARGIQPRATIATLGTLSTHHLLIFLGAMALGVAVVPLQPSAHPDALQRMLANSAPALLLTEPGTPDLPGHKQAEIAEIIIEAQALSPRPAQTLPMEGLVDVIYSSGTTGAPKGIAHEMCFRIAQIMRFATLGFGPERKLLISTPLYSNTTLSALIPALALGMQIVILRKFDARSYLELAQQHQVSHSMMVPVQIRRVLAHPEFENFDLSSHQRLLSTSAPLSEADLTQISQRWPGGMTNIFGLTEGGISTLLSCDQYPDKLHTVGKPGPTARIVILAPDQTILPQGEIGEIAGRSAAMMRGYIGDPEKTRATLWTSPEGEDFIRSGDMGYLDPDGFLVLLDRQKDMVISGGFNIYPIDLEGVLSTHPDVAECSVIGVPSADWGESPVAFVVPRSGRTARPGEILEWANQRLGRYQRMVGLRVIPQLPRSEIGKVLKTELRSLWQQETQG